MRGAGLRGAGKAVRSSPAVATAGGSIAFGSYDGSAYKVDATGKLLWSFKTAGLI